MQQRMEHCYQQLCNLYGEDRVFFVYLYGSQNYDLDSKESDVDAQAILFLPLEDLVLRKSLWTPILLDDCLCYITDLLTFLEELTQYVPKALELFITKNVQINPKYEDLFNELLAFKPLFIKRNILRGVIQFFGLSWTHYQIYMESNHTAKELIHAYRNMQSAYDLYRGYPFDASINCSLPNKKQLKRWKRAKHVPEILIEDFTNLSAIMEDIVKEIGDLGEPDPILPEIQEFCIKAYIMQQKDLT